MTDVVVLALIEDPMSFIDSKTVFTVHLQEKKGRWRNKRWRGGGRIYKSQGGKLQCSISSWKPPTRSHAGASALDTFIIVERHRTTPPPLSANPFLTIFTENTGFKYLGIMLTEYIIFLECTFLFFCHLYWTTARDMESFSLAFSMCTALSNVNRISLLASCWGQSAMLLLH